MSCNRSTRRTLYTAPTVEPVSFADLQSQLRLTTSDEETYVTGLQLAARRYVEHTTGLALVSQTWDCYYNDLSDLLLPIAPVSAVTSVKYYDADGVLQTVASTVYELAEENGCNVVRAAYNQDWPTGLRGHADDVVVRVAAGFGAAGSNVPDEIRAAIKLIVSHWFAQREPVNIGDIVNPLPLMFDALLAPYKVWRLAGV